MTDIATPDDRQALAAEYALGLLDGAERAEAAALAASDAEFRAEVARWSGRLAPLLDEIAPVKPPARLWARIDGALAVPAARSNVIQLHRRLNLWKGATAGAIALAASLALVIAFNPATLPPPPPPVGAMQPPMFAALASEESDARLVATWDPNSQMLMVAAAAGVDAVADRAHEVWLIPAGGGPKPLGMLPATGRMHMRAPRDVAIELEQGATLAISVEPMGGSPTGLPTGPVIAAGKMERT